MSRVWRLAILAISAMLVLAALAPSARAATTSWTCSRDGRLIGEPTGSCSTTLGAAGWYLLRFEFAAADSTGDIMFNIDEIDGDGYVGELCRAIAGRWHFCRFVSNRNIAGGDPDEPGRSVFFRIDSPATASFRVGQVYCELGTCTSAHTIAAGGFKISLEPSQGP